MTTQAYFENIRPEIVRNLEAAQDSIFLAVAWFTDNGLLEILEKKAQTFMSRFELFCVLKIMS